MNVFLRDYGVAAGTILCSNKNNTADRTERLNMVSIGIPVSEKYDRDNTKHTAIGVQRFRNVYDNKDWVDGVMNWLLTKVVCSSTVPSGASTSRPQRRYHELSISMNRARDNSAVAR